ncbi:hypothetical protein NDU88_007861 [Pleurodeles waltl]|uniref:Uncharacterized protein n=1 Tax=Pleurodeles waltl TaxID=8319 RepID=A0AAV7VQX7_PLEWA|nr:hypothetical protein NDU88_007861 [Pleurodeles waltl]
MAPGPHNSRPTRHPDHAEGPAGHIPPFRPLGEKASQQAHNAARPRANPELLGTGPRRNHPAAGKPVQGNSSSCPRPAHRARAAAPQRPNDGKAMVRPDRRSGLRREAPAPPSNSPQHNGKQRHPTGPANQGFETGMQCDHQCHRPHPTARPETRQ